MLLVILLSNSLARVLSQAASNDFPRHVVLSLIGLTSAGYLTIIVPIGFYLAIVLALGRLYHESEMAAIQACGVGPSGLFRPIGALGVIVAALLAWLSFAAVPQASARAQAIRLEALREAQFGALEPGRFRPFEAAASCSMPSASTTMAFCTTSTCSWTGRSDAKSKHRRGMGGDASTSSWVPVSPIKPSCCTTAIVTKAFPVAGSFESSSSVKGEFRFRWES